jgi:hypothetical protein
LPQPGSSQARQPRLTCSILASAEANPAGSPSVDRAAAEVGVELARARQPELRQERQLRREG